MGRKPIGERALSNAERARKFRAGRSAKQREEILKKKRKRRRERLQNLKMGSPEKLIEFRKNETLRCTVYYKRKK